MVPAAGFEPAPLQGLNLMSLPFGRRRHKLVGVAYRYICKPLFLQMVRAAHHATFRLTTPW